jgi:cytochrome P450
MYAGGDKNAQAYERSACPMDYFSRLRAENVIRTEEFPDQVMLLNRVDVEAAFRNWEDYSSAFGGINGQDEPLIPLNVDPPVHVKYRRILDPYFAPKKMATLQPAVEKHTNDLIDTFIDKGSCDFSEEVAVPMPCSTFLSLFGLSLSELETFIKWKDYLLRAEAFTANAEDADVLRRQTAVDVCTLMATEVYDRRANPKDDLITYLSQCEMDGVKLTDSEILRTCLLFFTAGLDTVTVSLECIFAYLLDHPDARKMLATEPGSEINLVEELLRTESPVQMVSREAKREMVLSNGQTVHKGDKVMIAIASANLDPDGLPGADTIDVRRGDMRNFAFGGGPHRCLGSNLARMELRTVVRIWHDRIPEYSLAPGSEVIWNSSVLRGVDHLPLVWSR